MDKRLHLAIILILCAVIGAGSAWIIYMNWYIVDQQQVPIAFQVVEGPHIGFTTDKDTIGFGKVPQGGGGERKATLESYVPSRARVSISGTPWVHADRTVIDLEPGTPQQVIFSLDVPENATPGNYTGTLRIIYTRR